MTVHSLAFELDGRPVSFHVDAGATLADLLSLHQGCGEGVCGSCTVAVDGVPVRSCLMLAVQAKDSGVRTIRSLPAIEGAPVNAAGLTPLQQALSDRHAFQCGWCVPGLLVGTACFLAGRTQASRAEILTHLVGHLCRCSAGRGMVEAIEDVLAGRREAAS